MRELTILPADTFVVVNRTILNEKDRRIINMLYQPIIGSIATSLYYTLWSDLDKTELLSLEYTHHHLMTSLRIKMDAIVTARKKLEAIGLVKTFIKKEAVNSYVYEIFSPISAEEFFNHPILNIVLYNNVGKKEYENLLNYFKVPKINLSGYEEITSHFDEVFESIPSMQYDNLNEDVRVNKTGEIKIDDRFDFDLLISSEISGLRFYELTEKLREALRKKIDLLDMKQLVGNEKLLNEVLKDGIKIYG